MGTLKELVEGLPDLGVGLEAFDRRGDRVRELDGAGMLGAIRAYRSRLGPLRSGERQRVALLFKSEEAIEFLIAAFAAMSHGFTVVPLYPNWDDATQQLYMRRYGIRLLAVGDGFAARADGWGELLDHSLRVSLVSDHMPAPDDTGGSGDLFASDMASDHPVAWIFTSGTSSDIAKCTEISLGNIEAAIENIRALDFLRAGMTVHCPLSASHIFAFVVIMGFLAVRPRRVLFSDVQNLARLPQEKTGKVDALILVPIVLNRMRGGFYEKLTSDLSGRVPAELRKLARIPPPVRRGLKRLVRKAEDGLIALEAGRLRGRLALPAILTARKLFGKMFQGRLGTPDFVVIGGAKPNLHSMAFLEVMGVRVLQGWGMTETTGPLCVCDLNDRRRGAFGTCGRLFPGVGAIIEEGELIVTGPQIATGYVEPGGTLVPFEGRKRTGDRAAFDGRQRLKVLGKVSDRITTDNGLNYFPIPMEDAIKTADSNRDAILEEAIVIGDAKPRLGCVFFLREGLDANPSAEDYCRQLVRDHNAARPVDEHIGPWVVSPRSLKDAGGIGPTGKLVRRVVEAEFSSIYGEMYA